MYSVQTTVANDSEEIIVHDVREAVDSKLSSRNLLRSFLFPEETTEPKQRDLYQPDGSTKTRILPDKLRRLPIELLYDTNGLEVFDQMIQLEEEYYLAACEKAALNENVAEIATHISDYASIIDLGCGNMEKTNVIVDHLRKIGKRGIKVYGVDIDGPFLENSLRNLLAQDRAKSKMTDLQIQFEGILATYEQSIQFLKTLEGQKIFFLFGHTIGNQSRTNAIRFLNMYREETMSIDDLFFLGFDFRKDPKIIARAYNDSIGLYQRRMRDAIDHLNKILGGNFFQNDDLVPFSGYNSEEGSNERYFQSVRDQVIQIPAPFSGHETQAHEVHLKEGELIYLMDSFKYSQNEIHELVSAAGFMVASQWTDLGKNTVLCMLKRCQEEE